MSTEKILYERSFSKCELCSSEKDLSCYDIPPSGDSGPEQSLLLCSICLAQISNPDTMDKNHWRCLNDSMWSEFPPVQVMAWRLLNYLRNESWALALLEQIYLDEETQKWAQSFSFHGESNDSSSPTKDSNGTQLFQGDTVTLIKDLVVKGANFTAKRGTVVKNIQLTENPEHIEGKVNGTQIVLLTKFLKKA